MDLCIRPDTLVDLIPYFNEKGSEISSLFPNDYWLNLKHVDDDSQVNKKSLQI